MNQIETEIHIQAKAQRVWQVLMDFENYPHWNPFIKSISGEKKPGGLLKVTIQPPEFSAMTIKPKVFVCDENSEFRWKGSLIIPGLFDGEHYFLIEPQADHVRFVHGEKFNGVLVSLFGSVLKKTKKGFEMMNQALKVKSEE